MNAIQALVFANIANDAISSVKSPGIYPILGKPMSAHVMAAMPLSILRPVLVTDDVEVYKSLVGYQASIMQAVSSNVLENVRTMIAGLDSDTGNIIIASCDMPYLTLPTVQKLCDSVDELCGANVLRDEEGNPGSLYCFNIKKLDAAINTLGIDATLLDCLKLIDPDELAPKLNVREETQRVTTPMELFECEGLIRSRLAVEHMNNGVIIKDFANSYIGPDVVLGTGVIIEPFTVIDGESAIGNNTVIGMGCKIHDSLIGENCVLNYVFANNVEVANNATIGPFVNLRPDTQISDNCHIGDFVEVKNSLVGEGTKLPHLSYIGDAELGKHVNVGCGSVCVNYDGKHKHKTSIGDNAFIGCSTSLVAPVSVGNRAFTAAGSVITDNVPDDALAIGRARQVVRQGWVRPGDRNKD